MQYNDGVLLPGFLFSCSPILFFLLASALLSLVGIVSKGNTLLMLLDSVSPQHFRDEERSYSLVSAMAFCSLSFCIQLPPKEDEEEEPT